MLVKELLELNYNNDYYDIWIVAADGQSYFQKNKIPTRLLNGKITGWRVDGNDNLTINIEGSLFPDGR